MVVAKVLANYLEYSELPPLDDYYKQKQHCIPRFFVS